MENKGFKAEMRWEISEEDIRKAFEEKKYFEAFVSVHYLISVYMNMTFCAITRAMNPIGTMNQMNRLAERWGKDYNYPLTTYDYRTISDVLCDMGIHSFELNKRLGNFATHRNELVHRLFHKLPTEEELEGRFKLGLELLGEVRKIAMETSAAHFPRKLE